MDFHTFSLCFVTWITFLFPSWYTVCFVELESFNFLFRPDGIGTITSDEKTWFEEIKVRLWNLLAYQITHYRWVKRLSSFTCVLACVAWRFCRAGRRSGVAAKFAREARENERRSREKNKFLPPQSPRGFSALARLYYLARPAKTAMLRRLLVCGFLVAVCIFTYIYTILKYAQIFILKNNAELIESCKNIAYRSFKWLHHTMLSTYWKVRITLYSTGLSLRFQVAG